MRKKRIGHLVGFIFALWLSITTALIGTANNPLVDAVKSQNAETVRSLIVEGANVNETEPDGATALHWSAYRDDLDTTVLLIDAGANVNAPNALGATPLWLAADNGSSTMTALLLKAGGDPNVALPWGETPVMTASRTGNLRTVQLLLDAGADANASEYARNQTALMWAVSQGHHAIVKTLLEHGADVSAHSKERPRLMHADSTNASQYDQGIMWNRGGYSPLLFAARQGHIDSAKFLLAAGANVNDKAPTGASALVVSSHSGHGSFATWLLNEGSNPNLMDAGYSALHAAILRGDRPLVEELLKHGADPNARLETGTPIRRTSQDWAFNPALVSATPYWLAAFYREPEIMRLLVAAGADPRLTTLELWRQVFERAGGVGPPSITGGFETPLMAAVRGSSDRNRFFLNRRDANKGEERKALETIKFAASLGSDIDAIDQNGNTVLHTAASRNYITIVQFLAERGASLNIKNNAGRTPLDLAVSAEERRALGVNQVDESSANTAALLRKLGATNEPVSEKVEAARR